MLAMIKIKTAIRSALPMAMLRATNCCWLCRNLGFNALITSTDRNPRGITFSDVMRDPLLLMLSKLRFNLKKVPGHCCPEGPEASSVRPGSAGSPESQECTQALMG